MGNQWDGGPMRWGTIGIGRWWGDEWNGGPMRWGTSDMGDQWDGVPMSSNNVLVDQWVGGPMRRGPMRWGTNETGDQWADPPPSRSRPRSGVSLDLVIDDVNITKIIVFGIICQADWDYAATFFLTMSAKCGPRWSLKPKSNFVFCSYLVIKLYACPLISGFCFMLTLQKWRMTQ